MLKTKRILLSTIVLLSVSLLLCGCSDKSTGNSENTSTAENISAIQTDDPNAVDPSEIVDLSEGVTDKMYNRAVVNEGSLERLAAAMKKAENGESITVGVIGGSITQGSLATASDKCYASLFYKWWSDKFPNCEINFINAGIGGTTSYLGVHRVDEQLLAYKPDVVVVEFSVNDTDKVMNKYSYDSLVRKILKADNNPAVILLFTTMEDGTSLQETHKEIGQAYNLPMISYHDVVYPEVAAGTLKWTDISPDDIHPNDAGHAIIGQLLDRYLDSVYDKLDTIAEQPSAFDTEPLTKDYYANAELCNAKDITPSENDGFEIGQNSLYSQFTDNWITSSGGTMAFDVECRSFGIFYLKTTDGKSGQFDVYVDGVLKGTMDADFSGGWGNYGFTQQFLISNEAGKHTVEIKLSDKSANKNITILALMIS